MSGKIGRVFKNSLHIKDSRDFLVFLLFLVVVFLYWYLVDIGEEHESTYTFHPVLDHVPDDVMITEPLPVELEVAFKDKGEKILGYRSRKTLQRLTFDYRETTPVNGHYVLTGQPLRDLIAKQFSTSAEILSYSPDTLQYYAAPAVGRRLPVRLSGRMSADHEHVINAYTLTPDSVVVHASRAVLDTMTAVWTTPVALVNLSDSVSQSLPLRIPQRGTLNEPSEVRLDVVVSPYVEKAFELPIRPYLCPYGQTLKTFPSRAKVTFLVSLQAFRQVDESDFELVVNYRNLDADSPGKAMLELQRRPAGIRLLSIEPAEVEYLLENQMVVHKPGH